MPEKTAILLLAHGSPESPADVPEFMRNITGGRPVPHAVMEEVKHRYGLIGRSPLTDITRRQAEALAKSLAIPVYFGMRNWKPFIAEAVEQMERDGVKRVVVICLAPQNSRTSVGLYRQHLMRSPAAAQMEIAFVESWHDHPLLVKAFAERLTAAHERAWREAGGKLPVIFTAHSVPERTIADGDPYRAQSLETAALVAKQAGITESEWKFAFQSQGMSGGPWIGPTVEETMLAFQRAGQDAVFLQPVGFVCDHVEVLYDIDIGFQQFAREHAMRLWRAESLNDSPALIAALADLARAHLA